MIYDTNCVGLSSRSINTHGSINVYQFLSPYCTSCCIIYAHYDPHKDSFKEQRNVFVRFQQTLYYFDYKRAQLYFFSLNAKELEAFDNLFEERVKERNCLYQLTLSELEDINEITDFNVIHFSGLQGSHYFQTKDLAQYCRSINPYIEILEYSYGIAIPDFQKVNVSDDDSAKFILQCYQQTNLLLLDPKCCQWIEKDGKSILIYRDITQITHQGIENSPNLFVKNHLKEMYTRLLSEENHSHVITRQVILAIAYLVAQIGWGNIERTHLTINILLTVALFRAERVPISKAQLDLLIGIEWAHGEETIFSIEKRIRLMRHIENGFYNHAILYIATVQPDYMQCFINRIRLLPTTDLKQILDVQNNDGRTALMIATKLNHVEAVKQLLDAGADPNLVTRCGNTALIHAVVANNHSIVRLLLEKNVDLTLRNYDNFSALDLALTKSPEIITLFFLEIKTYSLNKQRHLLASRYYDIYECLALTHPILLKKLYNDSSYEAENFTRLYLLIKVISCLINVKFYEFMDYLTIEKEKGTTQKELKYLYDRLKELEKNFVHDVRKNEYSIFNFKRNVLLILEDAKAIFITPYEVEAHSRYYFFSASACQKNESFAKNFWPFERKISHLEVGDYSNFVQVERDALISR